MTQLRRHIWTDDQAASMSLAGFVIFIVGSVFLVTSQVSPAPFTGRNGEYMFLSSLFSLAAFGGSVFILGIARHPLGWRAAGIRRTSGIWLLVSLLLGLFFVPVSVSLSLVIEEIITGRQAALAIPPQLFETVPLDEFVLVFLGVAVIVPVAEEIFFRGMLYQWLRTRTSIPIALMISSFVFGAVHLSAISLISLSVVGGFCALVYEYSGSIWTAIVVHAANNGLIVVLYYFVFKTSVIL